MKSKSKQRRHNASTYSSGLERINAKLLDEVKAEYLYEPKKGVIEYILPASKHRYTPDFYLRSRSGKIFIVETKGIWDYPDRYKHYWLRRLYPSLDIRFVFTRSATKTSKGAKQSYADICEGRGRGIFKGMTWQYADKKIPLEWLKE